MLEKPDIQDPLIMDCLRDAYGLTVGQLNFLPIGADANTAVFRAITTDAAAYFVKLRSGVFDEMSLIVPKFLNNPSIIAPLPTRSGDLWTTLEGFKVSIFPFIDGKDGYQTRLSDHQWIEFGRALQALHTTTLPSNIQNSIQRESYADIWRDKVRQFQQMALETTFVDVTAAKLAAFLREKQAEIDRLVTRAEALATELKIQTLPFVLCHADIHAGNVLIDADQHLYIVDWDTLTLAPKERDLMFVGGALFVNHRTPEEETRLFYQGYGQTEINATALAYYRHERIVQDIVAYCEGILLTDEGGEDRENGLRQLTYQFQPDQVVAVAFRCDIRS